MATIEKSPPQQLELRVFSDVNGGASSQSGANSQVVECRKREGSDCLKEATPEDRAVYRAIADRYFAS